MQLKLHANAATPPRVRTYIQASARPVAAPARELGISGTTVRRWQKRRLDHFTILDTRRSLSHASPRNLLESDLENTQIEPSLAALPTTNLREAHHAVLFDGRLHTASS
jgi:hypothetical protein